MKPIGILFTSACMSLATPPSNQDTVQQLLSAPPYNDTEMGKRLLVDQPSLFMMQVALKPGQMVPQHNANSHVHIMILEGKVTINLDGVEIMAKKGDLVPVAYTTPMNIKNVSAMNATFVIIKAPNPSRMGK